MGKNLLTEKVQEEVGFYIDFLANLKGKPIDIQNITSVSTCNIICSILVGSRFEYDDHDFKTLIESQNVLVSSQNNLSLINYAYWLEYIPGDYFNAKKLVTSLKAVMSSLGKFVDAKKEHFGDSSEVSDLIDAYNKEKNKKIQAGVSTYLDKKNLVRTMMDLFQGGTDTTSITICWVILYMLNYPEIQEKVYQEIKDKVGTDRVPTMQDKNQLVYLNAVIHETQRLASIVPLSVTHFCSETMTLRGYTIPKGTYILTNLDSVLHDKDTWGADAMSFRPERFIDDNGKLKVLEQFIPFGIGRRVCLGESLAKTGLFLYMASMFQRFHFLPSNPNSIPELKYQGGLVVATVPYEVKMVERK
uniref:Cytochrome P450 n=1 Tax=Arion vulgaris TaxID=1028688 RepID=A0A0B7BVS1_9EUPU